MLNIYYSKQIYKNIYLFGKNSINRIKLLTKIKKITRKENFPIYKVKTSKSFEILQ